MQRTRRVAGTPVRPAAAAWEVTKTLLADTLERSINISPGSVGTALVPLDGLVPSLAASGAIAKTPLTLIAGDLALDIFIVRGDDAFEIDENLAPVPGGASAPGNWKLYIQPPDHLNEEVTAAVDGSEHLAVGKPAAGQQQSASNESQPALAIDADALRRIGSAQ